MSHTVRLITSMATKPLLQDMAKDLLASINVQLDVESAGGVVAKERVEQGEAIDLVCLANDALEALEQGGHLVKGTIRPFVLSDVAVAIPEGHSAPALETAEDVKAALLNARTIGYSTGPSGKALLALLADWGIYDEVSDRLVQAPAGVPVAAFVARGEVELGFQQLSEMRSVSGIQVLGTLPDACRIRTCFSLALAQAGTRHSLSQQVLDALTQPSTAALKREHGLLMP